MEMAIRSPICKILVLTDEHGEMAEVEFDRIPYINYQYQVVRKLNTPIQRFLEYLEELTYDFNKFDYVIICAGLANVTGIFNFPIYQFRVALTYLQRCNVIIVELPYRYGLNYVNTNINRYNKMLHDLCIEEGAYFVELNSRIHFRLGERIIVMNIDVNCVFPRIMELLRAYMHMLVPSLPFHIL